MLSKLSDKDRAELSGYLKEHRLERGQNLFVPDDQSDGFFLIKSGRLGVQTRTGFGERQQVVALLDGGAIVGEKGLAESGPRKMTVVAIEDTVLLHLSAADFAEIERLNPALAIAVLKRLLSVAGLRLRKNSERLAHVL